MSKQILLVDDDSIVNFINSRVLQTAGVQEGIHIANNGQEALNLINRYFAGEESLPEIIFLDLNMPVMDGFTFIEAFKRLPVQNTASVMIVVLTSSSNPHDKERAQKLGIENYIVKPVTKEDVAGILKGKGMI